MAEVTFFMGFEKLIRNGWAGWRLSLGVEDSVGN